MLHIIWRFKVFDFFPAMFQLKLLIRVNVNAATSEQLTQERNKRQGCQQLKYKQL